MTASIGTVTKAATSLISYTIPANVHRPRAPSTVTFISWAVTIVNTLYTTIRLAQVLV